MSSGWVQVHLSGLPPSVQLETLEETTLAPLLVDSDVTMWAGPGTTVLKESRDGNSSYAFAAFYTMEGALAAVKLINSSNINNGNGTTMRAELSKPKKKKQTAASQSAGVGTGNASHVRLRRNRKPPEPKHPVVTSSAPSKKNWQNQG